MAGMKDVGFPKASAVIPKASAANLKEQSIRTMLRNIRARGHPYVELREDGKKLIFFCTLCLSPCYSDTVLLDHLKGNLHTGRLATARATLMKSNPWPFSDGVRFFLDDSSEQKKMLLVDNVPENGSRALVRYDAHKSKNHVVQEEVAKDSNQDDSVICNELVVPGVLLDEEPSDLVVRHIGSGRIGARLAEKNGGFSHLSRIWCEWLGKGAEARDDSIELITKHNFALVIFSFNYNLSRVRADENIRYLLACNPHSEAGDGCNCNGKKRKSFSDPEDMCTTQNGDSHSSKVLITANDDQQVLSRIVLSRSMRKKMRNYRHFVPERLCDICQQRMLPNKDVAALMNMETGRLVCSSRNSTGAFHLFHVSCLIHWILLCEAELYKKHSDEPKTRKKPRRRRKPKGGERVEKNELQEKCMLSPFCPECQGTGITVDAEDLEKPKIPLSEMFKFKITICDAYKAWIKAPEDLQNCSIGFSFPPHSDQVYEERLAYLKLLNFYRAVQ